MTWARTICLLFCIALLTQAQAQRVKFQSSGLVSFFPSPQAYIDAVTCPGCETVAPTPNSADIAVRVLRQANQAYTLESNTSGWLPTAELQLEARFVAEGNQSGSITVTDWTPLSTAASTLFQASDPVVDVTVEYRLRLSGRERAGSYETSVEYSAGGVSVRHRVRVDVPTALSLRVEGQAGTTPTVSFDYSGTAALSYARAVQQGEPLKPTGASLKRVSIFTNHAGGYSVQLELIPVGPQAGLAANRLQVFGRRADGQRLSSTGATDGFETLLIPEDFELLLSGDELPGEHIFNLRYSAVLNP